MRIGVFKHPDLRDWLRDASMKEFVHRPFVVDDAEVARLEAEARTQHPEESAGKIWARGVGRALALKLSREKRSKETVEQTKTFKPAPWDWGRIFDRVLRVLIIGLLLLIFLLGIPLRGEAQRRSLRVQWKDEGTILGTRGGGNLWIIDCTGAGLTCTISGATITIDGAAGGGGYATVEDEGAPLTQRTVLNLTGAGVTCVDDGPGGETDCDIPGGAGNLDLLDGSTHQDTAAGTAVRGDIVTVPASGLWTRFALGGANLYLKSDATDVVYSTLAAGGVGSCTNQFVSALNADAVPTCNTVVPADMDLTVTYTFNNAADSAYTAIEIQAGVSADQTALIAFKDFGGADEWTIGKTSGNAFRIHDTDVNVNRLFFTGGGNSIYRSGAAASDHLFQSALGTTRARVLGDASTLCVGTAEDTCLNRSAAGILDVTDVVDANTGFRIAGGAASGNVLRGNATDFVSAALGFSDLSGSATLAQLPFGAANQVLGTNAGATAIEHKTLATGTAGTDHAIVHTVGVVTFNLPVASTTNTGKLSNTDWDTFTAKEDEAHGGEHNPAAADPLNYFGSTPGTDVVTTNLGADPTNNNCVVWLTNGVLGDNGSACAGGSPTLDSIIAAAGTTTINSGDNAIIWNWQLTTSDKVAFKFGENVAGTATGDPILLNAVTLAASTVHPFQATARGTANGIRVGAADGVLIALGTGGLNWPALLGYPTGCTNQFVRTIADTLTCNTVGTSDIAAGAVDNTIIRDSAGFSVIGKTATGTGDPADIVAADETVLGRTGAGNLVFAQVATGQIANNAVTSVKLATANKTFDKSIVIIDPTTTEDDKVQWMHGKAVTYTDVDCSTDQGTATIDMDHRVITTPNTVGTDILTGTIVCDTDNQADGGFADATIPANVPVNLSITAVSGTPGTVRIHIRGTID